MLLLIRLLEEEQAYSELVTALEKKKGSAWYMKNGGAEAGGNKADDTPSIFFFIWHLSRFCFALQKVMNLKSEDIPQIPAELLQPPKGVPNQVLVEEKTA